MGGITGEVVGQYHNMCKTKKQHTTESTCVSYYGLGVFFEMNRLLRT